MVGKLLVCYFAPVAIIVAVADFGYEDPLPILIGSAIHWAHVVSYAPLNVLDILYWLTLPVRYAVSLMPLNKPIDAISWNTQFILDRLPTVNKSLPYLPPVRYLAKLVYSVDWTLELRFALYSLMLLVMFVVAKYVAYNQPPLLVRPMHIDYNSACQVG
jgi:hypothetical protein